MTNLTIQIPDDLARRLEGIALVQKKSVEEIALERLGSLFDNTSSPQAILQAIRKLPHPSPSAVDELDAAIASGRMPLIDLGAFDR